MVNLVSNPELKWQESYRCLMMLTTSKEEKNKTHLLLTLDGAVEDITINESLLNTWSEAHIPSDPFENIQLSEDDSLPCLWFKTSGINRTLRKSNT